MFINYLLINIMIFFLDSNSNEITPYEANENEDYQYLGVASNEFLKLFLFKYDLELPINLELIKNTK